MYARMFLAISALLPIACARLQGSADTKDAPTATLSAEEVRLARNLAEQHLQHSPGEKVYFIKTDLLPACQADSQQRQVNVLHYRYQGDETIITTVDLRTHEVLLTETLRHFPTALASEEKQRAEKLARSDPRCTSLFTSNVHAEFRPIQTRDSSDPMFGHRVVHVMLRDGPTYPRQPRILVDLTREVILLGDQ